MILAHALKHLFPNASPLLDYEIRDDGAGAYIAVWNLPDAQPSAAQLQTASDAYDVAQAAAASAASTLRTQIINAAQSAVGVAANQLTNVQVRALLAIMLWRAGGLTDAGNVRQLAQWADND